MNRLLRSLLLALALLAAQQGALLHAFEHAVYDLEVAVHDGGAPALGHGVEECVAYDAVGHVLSSNAPAIQEAGVAFVRDCSFPSLIAFPARVVFDSRAPPYSA